VVHCHVHKSLPLVPILRQINPLYTTPSYLLKIHFNGISHLRLNLPSGFPSSDLQTKILYNYLVGFSLNYLVTYLIITYLLTQWIDYSHYNERHYGKDSHFFSSDILVNYFCLNEGQVSINTILSSRSILLQSRRFTNSAYFTKMWEGEETTAASPVLTTVRHQPTSVNSAQKCFMKLQCSSIPGSCILVVLFENSSLPISSYCCRR
jgi:hypothetical protein